MEKKKDKGNSSFFKKIGASFQRKGFRSGVYATVTSVLVIVAVIIVNLIASASGVRKDLTATGENSLTEETKVLLDGLDEDLTFYFLTKGEETLTWLAPSFDKYMDLYQDASDRITFETVDLLLNPKFAEAYTDKAVTQYSVIVVNEETQLSKYIPVQDMVLTEMTMDQTTFQYYEMPVGIDIEGKLNAAIRYVVSGKQTNLYALTGHGENPLGTEGQNLLGKANINYNVFESMTAERVPEDCDVLFVTVPAKDYTDTELAMFKAYADRGGDFLILAEQQEGVPNYNRLLAYCGVQVENRIILEGDSKYHNPSTQLEIYPIIQTTHDITSGMSAANYLPIRNVYALTLVPDPAYDMKSMPLLLTSDKAYAKGVADGKITLTQEAADPVGPFTVGMYAKNMDTKSEAVVVSSGYVFADAYLALSNYANAGLLTNSVNYMAEAEAVSAIRTISFDSEEMLTINASQANAIAIVCVIVIPVALIAVGVTVMLRRRRR